MKVRLLVGLSGPAATLEPGDLYECDDAEGTRLVCARYALPADDEIEMRPAAATVETAAGPRKRRAPGAGAAVPSANEEIDRAMNSKVLKRGNKKVPKQ